MPNFVCKTDCYWLDRMWKPGDVYAGKEKDRLQKIRSESGPNIVPWHFEVLVEPVVEEKPAKGSKKPSLDDY